MSYLAYRGPFLRDSPTVSSAAKFLFCCAAIKAMVSKGQILSLLGTQLSFLFPVLFHNLSISLRIKAKVDIMVH